MTSRNAGKTGLALMMFASLGLFEVGLSSVARAQAPAAANAIVGDWAWFKGGVVTVRSDGTFIGSNEAGTWQATDPVRRTFTLKWARGWVDTIVLSSNSELVDGSNQYGTAVSGMRIHSQPPPAEIVGAWDWWKGGVVNIAADGSFAGEKEGGTWRYTDPEKRAYELKWKVGFVDVLRLATDGQSLEGENNYGTKVTARRKAAAPKSAEFAGYWSWEGGGIGILRTDGTVSRGSRTGEWHYADAKGRKFNLRWSDGAVEMMTLSADGKKIEGIDQSGKAVTATRK